MKAFVLFILFIFTVTIYACPQKPPVRPGAGQIDEIVGIISGRRVALAVNQTSVLENQPADGVRVHLLDTLLSRGVRVMKIFAPEHGFRGTAEAGEYVKDSRDAKTGVPIISIYGKNKKPSAAQLSDTDLVIFDIQDVGVRFYTYISTMHYLMEACAENDRECVILDRPNPNDFIDGPMRKKGFESFVGLDPIPLLHGLTVGELARMINGERWLGQGRRADTCRLVVVPVENWAHGDPYRLPVPPSPNLPNGQSVRLYASLGWFEATDVSIGRGTHFPFQVIGYPDPAFGGFTFTPQPIRGMDANPLQKGRVCYGVDLREYPFEGGLTLRFFLDFYRKAGLSASFFTRPEWFDLLAGNRDLRSAITAGQTEQEIRLGWQEDLERYKAMRKKYLLYPDHRLQTCKTIPTS
ncbi:MAG: DUF1343 domain-containing protein [Tannerellaceae bacterium]|jgi:uncharacterized protein YbbC (DUF1343 family)|nr:DUF1343 domain-containing protein [Tannerellaceae bacterium]